MFLLSCFPSFFFPFSVHILCFCVAVTVYFFWVCLPRDKLYNINNTTIWLSLSRFGACLECDSHYLKPGTQDTRPNENSVLVSFTGLNTISFLFFLLPFPSFFFFFFFPCLLWVTFSFLFAFLSRTMQSGI